MQSHVTQYSMCLIVYLAVCGHILLSLKLIRVPLSFHGIRNQQITCPTWKYRPVTNMNSGLSLPYQRHSKAVRLYVFQQENLFLMRFINTILVHINRTFWFQRTAPITQFYFSHVCTNRHIFYLNKINYFNYFYIT